VSLTPWAFIGVLINETRAYSCSGSILPRREATMVQIELDPKEAEILKTVLESYLSDLRMEIADTDSQAFREELKAQKAVLRKVVALINAGRGLAKV